MGLLVNNKTAKLREKDRTQLTLEDAERKGPPQVFASFEILELGAFTPQFVRQKETYMPEYSIQINSIICPVNHTI